MRSQVIAATGILVAAIDRRDRILDTIVLYPNFPVDNIHKKVQQIIAIEDIPAQQTPATC